MADVSPPMGEAASGHVVRSRVYKTPPARGPFIISGFPRRPNRTLVPNRRSAESFAMKVLVFIAFWGLVAASDEKTYDVNEASYDGYSRKLYHGLYPGKCQKDGFYYKDEYSFVMCSNGNAFEQRCAPGSKNSGYESYSAGSNYYIHDFCDVNMVDSGYNSAPMSYNKPTTGYEKPVPSPTKPVAMYNNVEKAHKVVDKHSYHQSQPAKAHYMGRYPGYCGADGFYYNDQFSFVMCSNGNAYVQRCAPGSRNSGLNRYQQGNAYFYNDFCDVNLVDLGFPGHYANDYYGASYQPNPRFFGRY